MPVSDKKREYGARFVDLVRNNSNVLVVQADNVGSNQMQEVRIALRGDAELVMGKNTTVRRVLLDFLAKNPKHPIRGLLPAVVGNVGFVFTNGDVSKVRDTIEAVVVPAPARIGALAPVDVYVEPGPTGCDPGQTAWFQALNIPTKINRGQIEMISRTHLIKAGDKVNASQAALLERLNIRPFAYSLKVDSVFQDGQMFDAAVLAIKPEDLAAKLLTGASYIAALGLAVGYPTKASLVHSINNAFKALISIHLGTDYKFARAKPFADFLANPSNFIVAAAPAAGGGGGGGAAAAAPVQEEEEEEEESVEGAGGLFGGSDSS